MLNIDKLLLIFSLSLLVFTVAIPPLFEDPDVAWHIAAGEYIVNHQAIPEYDAWSYIGFEQRWYNLSWLWDVCCFLLSKYFGFHGLVIITTLMLASLCTFIYGSTLARKNPISHDALIIAVTLTSLLFIDTGYLRPQLFSCLMTMIFIKNLHNFYYHAQSFRPWLLALYTTIWANIHGAFILIFAIFGTFIILSIYEKKSRHITIKLIHNLLLCTFATLINPLGFKVYIGVLRTLDSVITPYISEWRPFIFGQSYSFSLLLLVLLLSGSAINAHYCKAKAHISDWIFGLMFFIASLSSVRNFSIFAVVGAPFVASIVDRSLPKPKFPMKLKDSYKRIISTTTILLVVIINTYLISSDSDKKLGLKKVPVSLIEYVATHYPHSHIMNTYSVGGYIIMFGKNKFNHFIDGRAGTVFAERNLLEYLETIEGKSTLLTLAEKHHVDGIITQKTLLSKEQESLLSNWQELYEENEYVFLLNKNKLSGNIH